jgi:hypothetical protein
MLQSELSTSAFVAELSKSIPQELHFNSSRESFSLPATYVYQNKPRSNNSSGPWCSMASPSQHLHHLIINFLPVSMTQ